MDNTARHKRYIIIDSNCYKPDLVALTLRAAKIGEMSGQCDIRLYYTKSLEAEQYHARRAHNRHFKKEGMPHPSHKITYADALKGYERYIEKDRENAIDKQLTGLICAHLSNVFRSDQDRFYNFFRDERFSVVNPERDILALLENRNTSFFDAAYDVCMRSDIFKKTLKEHKLDYNMADHSLVDWYDRLLKKNLAVDVMLVTEDKYFLQRMLNLRKKYAAEIKPEILSGTLEIFKHERFASHIHEQAKLWGMHAPSSQAQEAARLIEATERHFHVLSMVKNHPQGGTGSLPPH